MPFEFIELVTGGFTLAAFVVACIVWVVMAGINRDRELIKHADDERKSVLVERALGRFSVDPAQLTKQQKYDLLMQSMLERGRFWNRLFVFLLLLSVVAAISTVLLLRKNPPIPDQVDSLQDEDFIAAQELYFFDSNYSDAFTYYEASAEAGNPYAQASLAKLYFNGWGVSKDEDKAHYWAGLSLPQLTDLANQDEEWALYSLGYLFNNGIGVVIDDNQAFDYYRRAALRNHWVAQNNLASFYRGGDFVEVDIQKTIRLFKGSIKRSQGRYALPHYNLANTYYYSSYGVQDFALALHHYSKAAQLGKADAMYMLGKMYSNGDGVDKNDKIAFDWYQKAMDKGNSNAEFSVAYAYVHAKGVKKNLSQAIDIYQRMGDLGNAGALNNLALLYEYGSEDDFGFRVEIDILKAMDLYQKSAELGNANAANNLGGLYFYGYDDVAPNYPEAYRWYEQASIGGNINGQLNLAYMYLSGRYVGKNTQKALALYQEAADQGSSKAMVAIGDIYRTRENPNEKLALEWYQKAMSQGTGAGYNAMGKVYAHGWGVEFDHEESESYFLKAVAEGWTASMWQLGQLYLHDDWDNKREEEAHQWHMKAALADNSCGLNSVGFNYLEGRGVKQDYNEAKKWFEKAARYQASAQFNLARVYEHGLGVKADLAKALEYYEKAVLKGHTASSFGVYRILNNSNFEGFDPVKAQIVLAQAANNGEPKALKELKSKLALYDKPQTCDMPVLAIN